MDRFCNELQPPPQESQGGGSSAAYIHTQVSPASTWTINHNLGFVPAVHVFSQIGVDGGGDPIYEEILDADIQSTISTTTIGFAASESGLARLS